MRCQKPVSPWAVVVGAWSVPGAWFQVRTAREGQATADGSSRTMVPGVRTTDYGQRTDQERRTNYRAPTQL